ncbi:DUF4132 domain-containing protein [Actinomadura rugatobispora]|uniref:DUF4132 domain-containing protein n=1 Tax=Actinomadura rugatobispora TaxID=1994 RepID=A0ABW1ACI4_9ACTN
MSEETLELPSAWSPRLHPRRGGAPVPAVAVDAAAPAALASFSGAPKARGTISAALGSPDSTPEVVEAARRQLDGDPSALGAAALAAILVGREREDYAELFERFVDSWVTGHGLPFAACALAELSRLSFTYDSWGFRGQNVDLKAVAFLGPQESSSRLWQCRRVVRKVRALLAVAGDDEYEETVKRLADHRDAPLQQAMVSYLVPDRLDWVEEACANAPQDGWHNAWWLLWCALGSPAQAGLLGTGPASGRAPGAVFGPAEVEIDLLATILDGVGPAIVPHLVQTLDHADLGAAVVKLLLQTLGLVPSDEAFRVLIERIDAPYGQAAVAAAAHRFPRRGMRMLAVAADGTGKAAVLAADLLRGHVAAHQDLVAEVLPGLPDKARRTLQSIAEATARLPEAPAEALPPVLVSPPWARRRKAAKPVVVAGLAPPDLRSVSWAVGESERWADGPGEPWRFTDPWPVLVAKFGGIGGYAQAGLIATGPKPLVRPLLEIWKPADMWYAQYWIRPIVARFGLDALPLAVAVAESGPAESGGVLLPFLAPEVAVLQARWLVRLKTARKHALAWFARHGTEAAMMLVPDALGAPGPARANAEGALRHLAAGHLATGHGADEVVEVARRYGDQAGEAIAALLASDPLDVLPARMPGLPDWADPLVLPQVLLRGRDRALPAEATAHLLTMLAMSRPDGVYPGVGIVRDACDPESLAEFSWAVFRRWQIHDSPSKDGWALDQLAWLGDDGTVRRLTPVVRAWPGEGGHSKAVKGLDVLAAIGTDVALMHLHGIAQKVRFKGLRTRAQEMIRQVAERLELTPEQLADRLVPDFGLDAGGGMTLDYGPRRFAVGFDEQLKPYVVDGDGKRRKALPKPGAKDHGDLAPAAYKRFADLKKDVRTVAADQIRRLESAMVMGRWWPLLEFTELFVGHPLVWHIVRRLVWSAEHDGATTLFRIAEDRTFADLHDDTLTLPASAEIRLPHPVLLGEARTAWAEVFADYEIVQPFPQLGRAVHTLPEDGLARFQGIKVPVGALLGLQRSGWERGEPEDAGIASWMTRPLGSGRHATLWLNPGIVVGEPDAFPEQTIDQIEVGASPYGRWNWGETSGSAVTGLDPVDASELLADLTALAASAPA